MPVVFLRFAFSLHSSVAQLRCQQQDPKLPLFHGLNSVIVEGEQVITHIFESWQLDIRMMSKCAFEYAKNGGLDIPTSIVSLRMTRIFRVHFPVLYSFYGLVGHTTSSAEGVCLVMAFAKAGGSFRHGGEGSLLGRLNISTCFYTELDG